MPIPKDITKRDPQMDLLTKADLEDLLVDPEDTPCVSIYLKTEMRGREVRKNPIKLKNLIKKAEKLLEDSGVKKTDLKKLLKKADNLINNQSFWNHQSKGLSIFLSPKRFISYRVPREFEDNVVVSNHFYIKPLINFATNDALFYILALSQKKAQLYQGTRQLLMAVEAENMPEDLSEALQFEDPEAQLQFHSGTTQSKNKARPGMHHGHGLPDDHEKNKLKRYFSKIDKALRARFTIQRPPLVIAGVDYLHALYEEVSGYQNLILNGIEGNVFEDMEETELHERAWKLIKPQVTKKRKEALEKYRKLKKKDKTKEGLEDILNTIFEGRAESLFVAENENKWGVYNPQNQVLHSHKEQKPESHDLLDLAAAQTLLTGGEVYTMDKDKVPGYSGAALIVRY